MTVPWNCQTQYNITGKRFFKDETMLKKKKACPPNASVVQSEKPDKKPASQ